VLAPLTAGPLDAELRLVAGMVDDLLGVLLLETGDARASAERHRTAIARLERAPPAEQANPALRRALSVAHQHLGDALAQIGGPPAALESFQQARAIRAELVSQFPNNTDYRHLISASDYWIGGFLADMGRYKEALGRYQSGLSMDRAEIARDPRNAANRSGLGFSLARTADMLLKLGRAREALADYKESLTIRSKELGADSTNLFKRFQLVESQAGVCRATAALSPAGADHECGRAADLMRGTSLDPNNAGYRGYLAGQYSDLAEVYDSLGARGAPGERRRHRLAALELYRRSDAIWSDLNARGLVNPTDTGRVTAAKRAVTRAEAALR
jgi:tetratricopeptide (TPR) repeat protein